MVEMLCHLLAQLICMSFHKKNEAQKEVFFSTLLKWQLIISQLINYLTLKRCIVVLLKLMTTLLNIEKK